MRSYLWHHKQASAAEAPGPNIGAALPNALHPEPCTLSVKAPRAGSEGSGYRIPDVLLQYLMQRKSSVEGSSEAGITTAPSAA